MKALKTGEMLSIPEYVADKNYKSTLNPRDFAEYKNNERIIHGGIFPLGSTHSGYKGDSMLRMIEVEHSIGGGPLDKVAVGSNKRISLAFQAQVIDCLYTIEEAHSRVRELMLDYETKYFGPSTRWPGDRSNKAIKYSEKEGIPYSDGQIAMLKRAASHVNLNFDELIRSNGRKPFPIEIFKK